jgi:hypothetical protein
VTKDAFVWITARDGSIHATVVPIFAAGQAMLCGHAYGRLDLRVRVQVVPDTPPAAACPLCCDRIVTARNAKATGPVEKAAIARPAWPLRAVSDPTLLRDAMPAVPKKHPR